MNKYQILVQKLKEELNNKKEQLNFLDQEYIKLDDELNVLNIENNYLEEDLKRYKEILRKVRIYPLKVKKYNKIFNILMIVFYLIDTLLEMLGFILIRGNIFSFIIINCLIILGNIGLMKIIKKDLLAKYKVIYDNYKLDEVLDKIGELKENKKAKELTINEVIKKEGNIALNSPKIEEDIELLKVRINFVLEQEEKAKVKSWEKMIDQEYNNDQEIMKLVRERK